MRLIDADKLIMELRLSYPTVMPMSIDVREQWSIRTEGYRMAEELIREAPTITADRPRGKWIDADGEVVPFGGCGCVTRSAWCSECGTWLAGSDEYLVIGYFCPNCGADMRGESDE